MSPDEVPMPVPMGEAGYQRLLDLLNNPPPVGDPGIPGLPPPGTPVPVDLLEWLEAFKEPLIYMTLDAAMNAVQAKLGGYSRQRLVDLYERMTPAQVAAVMAGNALVIKKFVDQRAAEAAMIRAIETKIVETSARLLFGLLARADTADERNPSV